MTMRPVSNTDKQQDICCCLCCDLLISENEPVQDGYIIQCPRCKHVLQHPTRLSIRNNFVCVFTGLIFYFPAVFLPIMQFTMLGHTQQMSILDCVQTLFATGNWQIGIIVFYTILLVPLSKMILMIFVTTHILYKINSHYLAASFKAYSRLNNWGMLDIFMLGIIISAIKLNDDALLEPGLGLYAFIILLFTSALQTQLLNKKLIWNLIEHHGK